MSKTIKQYPLKGASLVEHRMQNKQHRVYTVFNQVVGVVKGRFHFLTNEPISLTGNKRVNHLASIMDSPQRMSHAEVQHLAAAIGFPVKDEDQPRFSL